MPAGPQTADVNYSQIQYSLNYTAGANGSISGTASQIVNSGEDGTTVTAVPDVGYHFVSWSDSYPTAARTDLNVTANVSVTATFAIDTFSLAYTAGPGGTIVGTTPQTVDYNTNGTLVTATPDVGYHFVSWSDSYPTAARTDLNVTSDLNVIANFAIDQYEVTPSSSGNGTITPGTTQQVDHGLTTSFTLTPDANYHILDVTGTCGGTLVGSIFTTAAVTADCTVIANFTIDTFTITVTSGANGSITPAGAVVVNYGDTPTFMITPIFGYSVADVLVDNVSVGAVGSYQFTPVSADHTISASFTPVNTYAISGNIQQYNFPAANTNLAGVTVALSGDQTDSTTTDANGNYSFSGLPAGGNYLITPSLAGYAFDPISRTYSDVTASISSADFTGYTVSSPRVITVVSQNVTPGAQAVVPITMVSQGDENSLGLSVTYDPLVLNNPVVALGVDCLDCTLIPNVSAGHIGIIVSKPAIPTPISFAAGTRQLVTITFDTTPTPPAYTGSAITFGNSPIIREVTNANADPLLSTYSSGVVTFATGYESDVAPRFSGSNTGILSVSDYSQTGRFAAGLDTVNPLYNEFQRADSAPRATRGNGLITVSDYTQAGRYAAGLDPVQPVGGAAVSSLFSPEGIIKKQEVQWTSLLPRILYAADTSADAGQQVTVSIRLDANGDENGFGFTISYDGTKLSNPVVMTGADLPSSIPIANTLTPGKVGVITAWPVFGGTIPAGTREIVKIRFNVSPTSTLGYDADHVHRLSASGERDQRRISSSSADDVHCRDRDHQQPDGGGGVGRGHCVGGGRNSGSERKADIDRPVRKCPYGNIQCVRLLPFR